MKGGIARGRGGVGVGLGGSKSRGVKPLVEPFVWEGQLVVGYRGTRHRPSGGCGEGGGVVAGGACDCGRREFPQREDDGVEVGWRCNAHGGVSKGCHDGGREGKG